MRYVFLDLAGHDDLSRSARTLAQDLAMADAQVTYIGEKATTEATTPAQGIVVDLPGFIIPDTTSGDAHTTLRTLRQARVRAWMRALRPNVVVMTLTDALDAQIDEILPLWDADDAQRARGVALAIGRDGLPHLIFEGQQLPVEAAPLATMLMGRRSARSRGVTPRLVLATPQTGTLMEAPHVAAHGALHAGGAIRTLTVAVNGGQPQPLELGRGFPGPARPVQGPIDLAGEGCRRALRFFGTDAWGETQPLGTTVTWEAVYRPTTPRVLPVAVTADLETGEGRAHLRGRLAAPDAPDEIGTLTLEAWQAGRVFPVTLLDDGHFHAEWPLAAPAGVHLWARVAAERRREVHLCSFCTPAPGAGGHAWSSPSGTHLMLPADAPPPFMNGRPPQWQRIEAGTWQGFLPTALDLLICETPTRSGPWSACTVVPHPLVPRQTYLQARRQNRTIHLTHADGRTQTVHPLRIDVTAHGWTLVVRRGLAVEDVPLGDVVHMVEGERHWSAAADEAVTGEWRARARRLRHAPAPARAEHPTPTLLPLPETARRPAPALVDQVVLIRPGAFPTDDLYVLQPLGPLLATAGIPLVIPTGEEPPSALPPLTNRTVVVVSREAGPAHLARLMTSDAFVIYLIDDDIAAAADSPGLSEEFRRRMQELLASDVRPLLQRCDRLLVTSPGLTARYASAKTSFIPPPYMRTPASMAHLSAPEAIRLSYQGTDCHREDIEFLAPVLARLLACHDTLHVSVFGRQLPEPLVGHPRVEQIRPMGWDDYAAFVAANPVHISIAPMLDTPFNRGKSVVKVLDAASLGAAGVYSDVAPFNGVVHHDMDGLLVANDPDTWEATLDALIADPTRIATLAEAGQALARSLGAMDHARNVWRDLLGTALSGRAPRADEVAARQPSPMEPSA
ncbi:hypothetical protein [Xanthobacter sp. ZOL 2024]